MSKALQDWDISPFTQAFASTNALTQIDAVSQLFDAWYNVAKSFARGDITLNEIERVTTDTINTFISAVPSHRWNDPSLDRYLIRDCLDRAREILKILKTKPKFSNLNLQENFENWRTCLLSLSVSSSCDSSWKCSAIDLLGELDNSHLEWSEAHLASLVTLAVSGDDSIVRQNASDTITNLVQSSSSYIKKQLVLKFQDSEGALLCWNVGAFFESPDLLLNRLKNNPILLRAYITSLFEATVSFSSPECFITNASSICKVLSTTASTNTEEEEEDLVLRAIEPLIKISMNTPQALAQYLLLLTSNHPSASRISTLVGNSEVFSEECWNVYLLPFIREELASMSFAGVSGSEREQEVINLLREGSRVLLLSTSNLETGANIFVTMTQAIRHGYFETERFTELLAKVTLTHLPESAAAWLPNILRDSVSHNYKTSRAFQEVLLQVLGLESSSFGVDKVGNSENDDIILLGLATDAPRSDASDAFWKVLFTSYQEYLKSSGNDKCLQVLLHRISKELDFIMLSKVASTSRLSSVAELLAVMAASGIKTIIPALFDLTLKMMAISPSPTLEDTLLRVIESIPKDIKFTSGALERALRQCSTSTNLRIGIAKIAPYITLRTDIRSKKVVAAALTSIMTSGDEFKKQIENNVDLIINATTNNNNAITKRSEDRSESIGMDDFAFAVAACPILAEVAIRKEEVLGYVIYRIVSMTRVCAENHELGLPVQVTEALNRIASCVNLQVLQRTMVQSEVMQSCIPDLTKASAEFANHIVIVIARDNVTERGIKTDFTSNLKSVVAPPSSLYPRVKLQPLMSTRRVEKEFTMLLDNELEGGSSGQSVTARLASVFQTTRSDEQNDIRALDDVDVWEVADDDDFSSGKYSELNSV